MKGVSKQNLASVVSNAKLISMWIFVWWSFIFCMHHMSIKAIVYMADVIETLNCKHKLPSMTSLD